MVERRILTKDFLKNLEAPVSGERWISDTQIRGFGVRVWSYNGALKFAYAIRRTDLNGKSVRRSLGDREARWHAFGLRNRSPWSDAPNPFEQELSELLPEARIWAKKEIAIIRGKLDSDESYESGVLKDQLDRRRMGNAIKAYTLEDCADEILKRGKVRGWSQAYIDRLSKAFWMFLKETRCGKKTIEQLADRSLIRMVSRSKLGPGAIRLVRSLLIIIAENVDAIGGPHAGKIFPRNRTIERPSLKERNQFLGSLTLNDFDAFIEHIHHSNFDWRSRVSIELAFHTRVPFSRILRARWSEVHGNIWLPYAATREEALRDMEPKPWVFKFPYINWETESLWERHATLKGKVLECISIIEAQAQKRNHESDFWFPSDQVIDRPVQNVDRVWRSILAECDWPKLTLGNVTRRYHALALPRFIGEAFTRKSI